MSEAKLIAVTSEQFFAALYADRRDIMPSHRSPDVTVWEVVSTRQEWGRSNGWKSAAPETWMLTSVAGIKAPV